MTELITIPVWLFAVLVLIFILAMLDRILIPSTRWFLRRRINAVIKEIGTRLDIEIRPFQLTRRQVLIDRLAYDPQVIDAVKTHAHQKNMPVEMVQKKAVSFAKEIVPSFNAYFYFRIGYWVAKKIAKLLYRVRVGIVDETQYKNLDLNSTVVFVMNHRSNMDYILVAFLAAERTTLSYAVGEWAKIWPLHMLFKFMGAFFVRRNSKNALYRKILERYIHMATQQGVCQAVYLEGGLSKDGRLQQPKLGLIDYMLRNFDPEKDRDIIFIPVGINYDRTLEDRSLLRSLNPDHIKRSLWFISKTTLKFTLKNILQMLFSRWHRFGYACVNFGKPLSTKTYFKANAVCFKDLPKEQRFVKIKKLCDILMENIENVIPVVPVSVVSQIFIENIDKPLKISDIEKECESVLSKIKTSGGPVIETAHSTRQHAILEAISLMLLRGMIHQNNGILSCDKSQLDLLKYYANTINKWV